MLIRLLVISITLLFCITASAVQRTVNLYDWSKYIPDKVLRSFERETGIKVNLSEFDSNETLFAKLKMSPNAGYDVIVPSSYYIDRMRKLGMLHKLDKSKLPNLRYINPALINKAYDPHSRYSVPYLWGATGLVVNTRYYKPGSIMRWSQLWESKYKNKIMMLDDMREVFAIALLKLGYSVNDQNPHHIKQAYQELKKLLPNIRLFNSDAVQPIYIDEDITIGMGWNGDIYKILPENAHLRFIYPKDGFSIWIDCLAIPQNAPHLNEAYKFINFLMRPDISKQITIAVGYSSPNLAALKQLPNAIQNNPIINPDSETLKRGHLQLDIGKSIDEYAKYWQMLKIGG